MTKTITVTLNSPFTFESVAYSELTFRPATIEDLHEASRFEEGFRQMVAMLASMACVPIEAFRKTTLRDLDRIIIETAELFEIGRELITSQAIAQPALA